MNRPPYISGTRIAIHHVAQSREWDNGRRVSGDFQDPGRDDIRATLAFAAVRERRLAGSMG